jgi:argininosuccinate lyase
VHGQSTSLQWGGRFAQEPDPLLLRFGSSLEEDLVLAPFDVACSRAHVAALASGGIIDPSAASALDAALASVAAEIAAGTFAAPARASGAEDVHGAIDARVRELAGDAGEWLHAGRSRNDQVATTLLLYARDRATYGCRLALSIARFTLASARSTLSDGTLLAATTHWQPAQPVLLAFWLEAVAESFARAARRFGRVATDARESCPLGSGSCSGSSLPLDRTLAATELGFSGPSRNALDSVGDRDVALDLLHAAARAVVTASRVSEEIVMWCTPAFGYARLDDAASTGSSLMPQKRNPDPFELVRASAAVASGTLAGALGTLSGVALSYHRDLQSTKALAIAGVEGALASLAAFERAFPHVRWNASAMNARAGDGYVVATDVADALIAAGVTARRAHALVGAAVALAEAETRPLDGRDLARLALEARLDSLEAPLDAAASVRAKRTSGSTNPAMVARSIDALEDALEREFGKVAV